MIVTMCGLEKSENKFKLLHTVARMIIATWKKMVKINNQLTEIDIKLMMGVSKLLTSAPCSRQLSLKIAQPIWLPFL